MRPAAIRPAATWPAVSRRAAAALLPVLLPALLLAACRGPASRTAAEDPRRPTITVASMDFTESGILAELYAQVLAARGLPVERIPDLGSREVVEPALEAGAVDLVPEYLGTAVTFLSGGRQVATADSAKNHAELVRLFAARGISVLAHAPARDQNGFAVARATATARHLTRLSDLRPIAGQLVLGGPAECAERLLCQKGLEHVYGLEFKQFIPIASRAVTADALADGEIDVGLMDTTDAYLAAKDLFLLADDRKLQPADNVVPVVRTEIVRRYGQQLVNALNAVSALLTTPDLVELNRQATIVERPAAVVAHQWLASHHLVP